MGCGCGGRAFRGTGVSTRSRAVPAYVARPNSTNDNRPPSPMRAPDNAPLHIMQSQTLIQRRQNLRRAV